MSEIKSQETKTEVADTTVTDLDVSFKRHIEELKSSKKNLLENSIVDASTGNDCYHIAEETYKKYSFFNPRRLWIIMGILTVLSIANIIIGLIQSNSASIIFSCCFIGLVVISAVVNLTLNYAYRKATFKAGMLESLASYRKAIKTFMAYKEATDNQFKVITEWVAYTMKNNSETPESIVNTMANMWCILDSKADTK